MVKSNVGFVFQSETSLNRKDYRPQLFDKIQIQNTKPFMVTHVYSLFWVYGLVKTTNDWNQHMCILKLSVHDFYFFLIFGSTKTLHIFACILKVTHAIMIDKSMRKYQMFCYLKVNAVLRIIPLLIQSLLMSSISRINFSFSCILVFRVISHYCISSFSS